MYRETMNVVRMHELLIDNIEGHIDDTEENVSSGKRHLSELHGKEQKNRQFIYKVFGVLYFIVFVYLVILS
jgi:t-SNARE complex subunit (syntaxin)